MSQKVAEFECQRKDGVDNEIIQKNARPVNLCVQVWDNNLVSLSFGIEKEIGCFRLCWGSFMGFVECIEEWFFDGDDTSEGNSCIDNNVWIRCTAYSDYTVSVALSIDGGEKYDIVFATERAKFLGAVDAAVEIVDKLMPNEPVCFDENKTEYRVLH